MKLWYRVSGKVDGPPIIFLHGLFASSKNWQSIVKRLSDSYRLINIDLPNHGNSPHTTLPNYEEILEGLDDLIQEEVPTEKVTLIGHSMGGKVGMLFALLHPDRIDKLVVEDISPRVYVPKFFPLLQAMKNMDLSCVSSRRDADKLLAVDVPDPLLRMFLMTNLVYSDEGYRWRLNLDGLIAAGPAMVDFPGGDRVYHGPVLFIRGGDSSYVLEEDSIHRERYFPSARLETIEKAGHWVHAQHPEEFVALLRPFLEE